MKNKNKESLNYRNDFVTVNDKKDEHVISFVKTGDDMMVILKKDDMGIISVIDKDFNVSMKYNNVDELDNEGLNFNEYLELVTSFSDNFVVE